jgi:glycosyltransferase involved in cell wall biosynthesis
VTGALVPPRDAAALAGGLRAYLRDPGLRRGHGREGRKRVLARFSQEALWEALYQEYRRLLEARGVP